MNVGERIKFRREQIEMSQDELARLLGYKSRSSINKIETAGYRVPSTKIALCAKALRTTPAYLMGWEDSKGRDLTGSANIIMELYNQLDPDDQAEVVDIMKLKLSRKKDTSATERVSV